MGIGFRIQDSGFSKSPLRVVGIIQARMQSSRLPGKVLMDIAGQPMLHHIVTRATRACRLDQVAVATSDQPADDVIAAYCARQNVACFRGHETDVLDRYYRAAAELRADVIVRLTADCPLHDPQVMDLVAGAFLRGTFDYVSNVDPPTYPDGLDVEAFSFAALERAWKEARLPSEREHVTPFLRDPARGFRTGNVMNSVDYSVWRWTVDELADLHFARAVFDALGREDFAFADTADLIRRCPRLSARNAHIARNEGYALSLRDDGLRVAS